MKKEEKVEFRKSTDDDIFRQAMWYIENSMDFAKAAKDDGARHLQTDFQYTEDRKKEFAKIAVSGLRYAADTIEGLMKEGYFK